MDLKVTDVDGTAVSFEIATDRLHSGIQSLIQEVLVELLSDVDPVLGRGAGLRAVIELSSPTEESVTRNAIRTSVLAAKSHILSNQQLAQDLTTEERLRDLRLISLESLDGINWSIGIQVVNQAGDNISRVVTL